MRRVTTYALYLTGLSSLMGQALAAEQGELNLSGLYQDRPILSLDQPWLLDEAAFANDTVLTVDGEFGSLSFGRQDGASDQLALFAPNLNGSRLTQDRVFQFIELSSLNSASSVMVGLNDDQEKILYVTPRIAGLQAGISIAPDTDDEDALYLRDNALALSDGLSVCGAEFCDRLDADLDRSVEVGLAYSGSTERGINYDMSATYLMADQNTTSTFNVDDPEAWTVGANIGFAGFTFGGSYQESDNILGEGAAYESWDVGATYERGPWGFMLSYAEDECTACDLTASDLNGETSAVQGGVDYSFGNNVSFGGGLQYKENETITEDEDSAVIYLETMISF